MLLQSIAVLLWQKQQEQQQTLQLLLPPLLFQSPKGTKWNTFNEYVQCSRKGEFSKIFHLRHHFWERLIKITVIVGYILIMHTLAARQLM